MNLTRASISSYARFVSKLYIPRTDRPTDRAAAASLVISNINHSESRRPLRPDMYIRDILFNKAKHPSDFDARLAPVRPIHRSQTILQKQFRKMSEMRQPPAIWIPGLPNWPSPLHNDASTLTPRPLLGARSFAYPSPKPASLLTRTRFHHNRPPTFREM